MSRTLRRGFSDEIGSWKIICIRVRAARISFVDIVVSSAPSNVTDPDVGAEQLHDRSSGGALAATRLAHQTQRLPALHVEADARHGVDDQAGAPDGELDDEILDAQQRVLGVARWALPVPAIRTRPRRPARRVLDADGDGLGVQLARRSWYSGSRRDTSRRTGGQGTPPGSAEAPRRGSGPGRTGSEGRSGTDRRFDEIGRPSRDRRQPACDAPPGVGCSH